MAKPVILLCKLPYDDHISPRRRNRRVRSRIKGFRYEFERRYGFKAGEVEVTYDTVADQYALKTSTPGHGRVTSVDTGLGSLTQRPPSHRWDFAPEIVPAP